MLKEEVQKFRAWAETQTPEVAEWEWDYSEWPAIHESVTTFLETPVSCWTSQEVEDLLYILARDWDCHAIADDIKAHGVAASLYLSEKALEKSDWDARYQLASILGDLPVDEQIKSLLLRFVDDDDEYVRRCTLQAMTRLRMSQVEMLALREWQREHINQQWAQMNALWCWCHIGSPLLEPHLLEAERSPLPYLSYFADKMRRGEIEGV